MLTFQFSSVSSSIPAMRSMFTWSKPGHCAITLLTAGNLATTQSIVSILDERTKAASDREPSIVDQPSMFQVARLVGQTLKEVIALNADTGQKASTTFNATIILGGQVKGGEPRLFLIYPEGNFVEASTDTPFFQIGETKYGRPILVRAYDAEMSLEDGAKLMLVSFDSTIKANLSVGLPLDLLVYEKDTFEFRHQHRIEADDDYYHTISNGWGNALKKAFHSLPDFSF